MTTDTNTGTNVTAAEPTDRESPINMATEGRADVARRFRTMVAGDHEVIPELYADHALLDVNLPEWRYQLRGSEAIRRQLDEWHPAAPHLVEWNEQATEHGILVALALWEGDDHELYSRSLHELDISNGRVTRHAMYCIGNLSKETHATVSAALLDDRASRNSV